MNPYDQIIKTLEMARDHIEKLDKENQELKAEIKNKIKDPGFSNSMRQAIEISKDLSKNNPLLKCRHEPLALRAKQENTGIFSVTLQDLAMAYHCKYCGVKIRANEWVEDNA